MNRSGLPLFEAIGGEKTVSSLVETFYRHVKLHPVISSLFPDDMSETIRKQKQFLTQLLGGPQLYSAEHGHPMLRRRHLRFKIGAEEADAWLACMSKAMNDIGLEAGYREIIFDRLSKTAHHMINQPAFHYTGGVISHDLLR
ncbi:globin [Sporolactobacillus sp. CQH2019]|uniref:globin domain-containing protein n=1 Tax=Sporolactobacillus sp. CQH2019 TaxID=3023512 RepID=UPI002367ADB6|nr:globin [Sporolactobacillus sp. CQH2019]MDD9147269.1 globin [Sporolactobacillus sp. CQH2019]